MLKCFDKNALRILKKKKNLRIVDISKFKEKNNTNIKFFDGSFMLQDKDNIVFKNKLKFVTKINLQKKEIKKNRICF